jgi:hypothetical protein
MELGAGPMGRTGFLGQREGPSGTPTGRTVSMRHTGVRTGNGAGGRSQELPQRDPSIGGRPSGILGGSWWQDPCRRSSWVPWRCGGRIPWGRFVLGGIIGRGGWSSWGRKSGRWANAVQRFFPVGSLSYRTGQL